MIELIIKYRLPSPPKRCKFFRYLNRGVKWLWGKIRGLWGGEDLEGIAKYENLRFYISMITLLLGGVCVGLLLWWVSKIERSVEYRPLVDVNNVVYETRPLPEEIIVEILESPASLWEKHIETYKKRTFKWMLMFKSLRPLENGMSLIMCETSSRRTDVRFEVDVDARENLKAKHLRRGDFLEVSGEIEDILLKDVASVDRNCIVLKGVRLEFMD